MHTHINQNRPYKAGKCCPRQPFLLQLRGAASFVARDRCDWEPLGGSSPKLLIMNFCSHWYKLWSEGEGSVFAVTPGTTAAFTQYGLVAPSS